MRRPRRSDRKRRANTPRKPPLRMPTTLLSQRESTKEFPHRERRISRLLLDPVKPVRPNVLDDGLFSIPPGHRNLTACAFIQRKYSQRIVAGKVAPARDHLLRLEDGPARDRDFCANPARILG